MVGDDQDCTPHRTAATAAGHRAHPATEGGRHALALAQLAAALTLEHSLEAIVDTLAASVVTTLGAVACSVGLVGDDVLELRLFRTHGFPAWVADHYRTQIWPLVAPELATTAAMRTRTPRVGPNVRQAMLAEPRYAALHDHLRTARWDTVAVLPLVVRGRALGALNAYYPAAPPLGDAEVTMLRAVADLAAVAVENARLFTEAEAKAVLEERQRLARELHDSVAQVLFAIGLGARTVRTLLERGEPAQALPSVEQIAQLAGQGTAEMRALLFALRPESLEQEGLVAALTKQAAALQARHGLVVELDLGAEPDVSLEVKEALYRIAQEATHNTVKHARASRITVRLACGPAGTMLEVADDGVGFEASGSFPGHLGLVSMRERVARLGGAVALASAPGRGSTVQVHIPAHHRPDVRAGAHAGGTRA